MGNSRTGVGEGGGSGRRALLQAGAAGAVALLAAPAVVRAAATDSATASAESYPKHAFLQTTEAKALGEFYGQAAPEQSGKITLQAPEIAENGAVVPVVVASELPDVTGMALLALNNPYTLACIYKLPPGTMPEISSRLKLKETTTIVAVVASGGKLYSTSKLVKVTLGGCG